eukprot:2737385-Rhodomonas_salina.1
MRAMRMPARFAAPLPSYKNPSSPARSWPRSGGAPRAQALMRASKSPVHISTCGGATVRNRQQRSATAGATMRNGQ